jgi:hypothetical protein
MEFGNPKYPNERVLSEDEEEDLLSYSDEEAHALLSRGPGKKRHWAEGLTQEEQDDAHRLVRRRLESYANGDELIEHHKPHARRRRLDTIFEDALKRTIDIRFTGSPDQDGYINGVLQNYNLTTYLETLFPG